MGGIEVMTLNVEECGKRALANLLKLDTKEIGQRLVMFAISINRFELCTLVHKPAPWITQLPAEYVLESRGSLARFGHVPGKGNSLSNNMGFGRKRLFMALTMGDSSDPN